MDEFQLSSPLLEINCCEVRLDNEGGSPAIFFPQAEGLMTPPCPSSFLLCVIERKGGSFFLDKQVVMKCHNHTKLWNDTAQRVYMFTGCGAVRVGSARGQVFPVESRPHFSLGVRNG